jgi:CRISPR-associated protein Cmr6
MPIEMNSRREKFEGVQVLSHSHAGLWLERYVEKVGDKKGGNATTIEDVTKAVCISGEYQRHYKRWERELLKKEQEKKALTKKATVQGRLVVGLGAESILETAITLHRTYGVPFIPGSALKGLASAAAHRFLTNDEWRKKTKTAEQGDSHKIMFGNTKTAGFVTFHDALLVPEGGQIPLDLDVMTVHHAKYYGNGKSPPADWDSPNPVSFVTARGTYLIALEGPEEWTRAAMDILGDALQEDGIGAKTAAGYGRMKVDGHKTPAERKQEELERKKRQEEEVENQKKTVENLKKGLGMGNAGDRVPKILANTPEHARMAVAKSLIKDLKLNPQKIQQPQPWIQDLFSAAGEPLP